MSQVTYACTEGNCSWQTESTGLHNSILGVIKAADRQAVRGTGMEEVHPFEKGCDGWGAGMPGLLQETESYYFYAKVVKTNEWVSAWVVLLRTPRHWCLTGCAGSQRAQRDPADWEGRPLATGLSSGWSSRLPAETHQTLAVKRRSPDSFCCKCSECLHNPKHFLGGSRGDLFRFFFSYSSQNSYIKQSSHVLRLCS